MDFGSRDALHWSCVRVMPCSGLDEYTLSKSLKAATATALRSSDNHHGRAIHATITKLGLSRFTILMTALIDLYLKSGHLPDARNLFDELPDRDVVAWTSMIVGHARHPFHHQSLSLFRQMLSSNTAPNGYSFSGALTACSGLGVLSQGKQIHAQLLKTSRGRSIDPVLTNSLLYMYCRCGCLLFAQRLFDSMPSKTVITWNEMMSGYLPMQAESALKLLVSMVSNGARPDDFSYAICTDACAVLASIRQGIQIHACIVKVGFHSYLVVRNNLVGMYAKCGCVDSAQLVFDKMPTRDPVLWTAMISALGKCGRVHEAITMVKKMVELNIRCDEITHLAVLSACSHGGLVSEGWHYFRSMFEGKNTVAVMPEHYGCMVDLLCRSGFLNDALGFIEQMPFEPGIAVWSAFLASCRMRGNTELGQLAASRIRVLDPGNDGNRVVLSSIHAAESEWDEMWRIRESMKAESVKKEPGCSWIEVNNGVHVFLSADKLHPELGVILQTLHTLKKNSQMVSVQREAPK